MLLNKTTVIKKNINKYKKKITQIPSSVTIKIQTLINSTRVDVVDKITGNVYIWKTASLVGYKNSKKSSPLATVCVIKEICSEAITRGVQTANVELSGIGVGRSVAIKKILESNIKIESIKYVVKLAHNGCRPRKARRN